MKKNFGVKIFTTLTAFILAVFSLALALSVSVYSLICRSSALEQRFSSLGMENAMNADMKKELTEELFNSGLTEEQIAGFMPDDIYGGFLYSLHAIFGEYYAKGAETDSAYKEKVYARTEEVLYEESGGDTSLYSESDVRSISDKIYGIYAKITKIPLLTTLKAYMAILIRIIAVVAAVSCLFTLFSLYILFGTDFVSGSRYSFVAFAAVSLLLWAGYLYIKNSGYIESIHVETAVASVFFGFLSESVLSVLKTPAVVISSLAALCLLCSVVSLLVRRRNARVSEETPSEPQEPEAKPETQ